MPGFTVVDHLLEYLKTRAIYRRARALTRERERSYPRKGELTPTDSVISVSNRDKNWLYVRRKRGLFCVLSREIRREKERQGGWARG